MDFTSEFDFSSGNSENKQEYEEEADYNLNRGHRNTFVGTAEYVSPEVLMDKPAGPEADLWALGCIIYQMFSGTSPFKDKTEYLVFKKILEVNFTFSDKFNEEAKDLINSLLIADPNKRLGSGSKGEENDFKALKYHPFFTGLDFEEINKIDPPLKEEFKTGKFKNDHNKQKNDEENLLESRHKNTILIIKNEIIEKKSPWFLSSKYKSSS